MYYVLQGDVEEDEMIPDKESDIKPRFHRAKSHSQKHQDGEVKGSYTYQCLLQDKKTLLACHWYPIPVLLLKSVLLPLVQCISGIALPQVFTHMATSTEGQPERRDECCV